MEKDVTATVSDERTPFITGSATLKSKTIALYHRHKWLVIIGIVMLLLLPLLALLALRNRAVHAAWTSPVVYPSRMYSTLFCLLLVPGSAYFPETRQIRYEQLHVINVSKLEGF